MTAGPDRDDALEDVELDGIGRVRARRSNRDELALIAREITGGDYEGHGLVLEPGATVIDAGANLGLFSLYAARRGADRVLAFEPIPETFALLAHNLASNPHGAVVHAVEAGLGALGGPSRVRFTHFPRVPGSSTMHPAAKAAELEALILAVVGRIEREQPEAAALLGPLAELDLRRAFTGVEREAELTTLSDALDRYGLETVDLLKIDVEGAEAEVLAGLADAEWPRIRQIALETHGDAAAARLADTLAGRGFTVERGTPDWAAALGLENRMVWGRR